MTKQGELFARHTDLTLGLEEEVFLVDSRTGEPAACEMVPLEDLGAAFKRELPDDQVELLAGPATSGEALVAELADRRARLLDVVGEDRAVIAAGVHPTARLERPLGSGGRYTRIAAAYGRIASLQQVASLHVHLGLPLEHPDGFVAVFNAFRRILPELAALSANSPILGGEHTGLASVRPLICSLLPRQGVPPAMTGWPQHDADLAWLEAHRPGEHGWWWELRPNVRFGTLELRVFDSQSRLADIHALVAVVSSFARMVLADGAEPAEAGDEPATWRIEENRFSALRHGADGELADLEGEDRRPARLRISALLDRLRAHAPAEWDQQGLDHAARWLDEGGYLRQARVFDADGGPALVRMLTDEYGPSQTNLSG